MSGKNLERKIRAIFSADVKGYSRLMGEDEEHTVSLITSYRQLIAKLIKKHQGRVVDSPGDNILAQFGSAVNSVRSAAEIQTNLRKRNEDFPHGAAHIGVWMAAFHDKLALLKRVFNFSLFVQHIEKVDAGLEVIRIYLDRLAKRGLGLFESSQDELETCRSPSRH